MEVTRAFTLVLAVSVPVFASANITSLSDNFDTEALALSATNLTNWSVTGGNVDVIGAGFFDLQPGNGRYLDLDGTNGGGGLLSTKDGFEARTYDFSFKLAGSQRGDLNLVTVKFGSYNEIFEMNSATQFTTFTRTATVTAGSKLSFQNSGFDDFGALLDNVNVNQAVPEPASMAVLGLGAAFLAKGRKRK